MARAAADIHESDAAYLFVKSVIDHVSLHWPEIKHDLSLLVHYSPFDPPREVNDPPDIQVNEEKGIHEFALALMAIELFQIPPQIQQAKGNRIIHSVLHELTTLDNMTGTPTDHRERLCTYLDLLDRKSNHAGKMASLEIMLYDLYRRLEIQGKNLWSDLFFSSRFARTILKYTGDFWRFFLDNYTPPVS